MPSTETYFEAQKNGYLLEQKDERKPEIAIVNMTFERQILSQPLQDRISENLQNNLKTIVVLNRKGNGTKLTCVDCGWVYQCQKCGIKCLNKKDGERTCQTDKIIQCHHIISYNETQDNSLNNLQTLCLKCHYITHKEIINAK